MLSTSHEEIVKHPTNTSPTKQQFSFSRSPRFPSVPGGNAWVQYDNSPTHLSNITFSVGRGPRSDFTKAVSQDNPAPTAYKATDGIGTRKNMGWKSVAPRGLSEHPRLETLTFPGPGTYDHTARMSMGSVGQKYSMRVKPPYTQSRFRTPGPGAYNPKEEFDSVGRYYNSKYQSSGARRIAQAKEKLNSSVIIPGPGAYDPKTGMSRTGEYFVTTLKNAQSRSFGKAARRGFPDIKLATPGPGTYRTSSDFGLYETVPASSGRNSVSSMRNTNPA